MASASRPVWIAPFAICCLLLIALLLASTIVLALIPIYLSQKTFDTVDPGDVSLPTGYASDATDGRSLTLANTNSVGSQLAASSGLSSDTLGLDAGNFIAASAAARKKRQSINGSSVSCERATGLTGDIFVAQYRVKYPRGCVVTACKRRFLAGVQTALRTNYQVITVVMNFTDGSVRTVRLVFCGFFDSGSSSCPAQIRSNMYLFDMNSTLYQFNPNNFNLTSLGKLNCSSNANPLYSIAVQRDGVIWALFEDGNLYRYNIQSQQCRATNFVANQSSISLFTMTFLRNVTANSERLLVSKQNNPPDILGEINLSTLALSTINNYSNLSTYADLAGTADGRLFGVFETNPYTIAQIDPNSATILAQYLLNVTRKTSDPNYGFAAFNNLFYFFEGNNTYTDIHIFNPATNATTTRSRISQVIFGASASSCLGT